MLIENVQSILWGVSAAVAAGAAVCVLRVRGSLCESGRKAARTPLLVFAWTVFFAFLVVPSITFVPAGHRGAVYSWGGGVQAGERGEGLTILAPWVQRMTLVSVRTQKVFSSKVYAQSKDLQEITVVASVNYHVRADRAAELYQSIGPGYRETVIQPALFQRTKTAVGRVRAEDFAKSREPLAETIRKQLKEQLAPYGIEVEYVNIEDAVFDPEFIKAVKEKVVAEQEAKEQQNLIVAKEALKQQTIIKAEGDARAIRIKANAQAKANRAIGLSLTPAMLRWQWLVTWNGSLPSTLVGGADTTLLLNTGSAAPLYPNTP